MTDTGGGFESGAEICIYCTLIAQLLIRDSLQILLLIAIFKLLYLYLFIFMFMAVLVFVVIFIFIIILVFVFIFIYRNTFLNPVII